MKFGPLHLSEHPQHPSRVFVSAPTAEAIWALWPRAHVAQRRSWWYFSSLPRSVVWSVMVRMQQRKFRLGGR